MNKLDPSSVPLSLYWMLIVCLLTAGCAATMETSLAKSYQEKLASMSGQKPQPVLSTVTGEWKFEVANSWEGERPEPERVNKVAVKVIKFTKEEIQSIFAEPGKYKVMVFSKVVGSTSATTGEVDGMGFSLAKDSTYESNKYCVIRLVFRDDSLIDSRVWPNLDRGRFVEGTTIKRF